MIETVNFLQFRKYFLAYMYFKNKKLCLGKFGDLKNSSKLYAFSFDQLLLTESNVNMSIIIKISFLADTQTIITSNLQSDKKRIFFCYLELLK